MVPSISNYMVTEYTLRSESAPGRHFLPIRFSVDQQQWSQVTVTSFPSLRALNLFDPKAFKNSLTESPRCRVPEYPVSERQTSTRKNSEGHVPLTDTPNSRYQEFFYLPHHTMPRPGVSTELILTGLMKSRYEDLREWDTCVPLLHVCDPTTV
jgi:hypothetical protein